MHNNDQHARHRRAANARPGVTLAELLTVVGVIALLLSIALPAVNMSRNAALSAKCQANMRQIMLGVHSYAADNHEHHRGFRSNKFQWFHAADHSNKDVYLLRPDDIAGYWGLRYLAHLDTPSFPDEAYEPGAGIPGTFRAPAAWDVYNCPSATYVLPQDEELYWENKAIDSGRFPDFDQHLRWSTYALNGWAFDDAEQSARFPGALYERVRREDLDELLPARPIYGVLSIERTRNRVEEYSQPRALNKVLNPSKLIFFTDGSEVVTDGPEDTLVALDQPFWVERFGTRWSEEYYRHASACNIAWVDGHVSTRGRSAGPLDPSAYTGHELFH